MCCKILLLILLSKETLEFQFLFTLVVQMMDVLQMSDVGIPFQAKMDSQIETSVRYIEHILRLSFIMTRQPDSINVMQTPSTQRIVSNRLFNRCSY